VNAFNRLFWGSLLVLVDIRLNGFDIVVDLPGYVLILMGCTALAATSRRFRAAAFATIPLLLLSVTELLSSHQEVPVAANMAMPLGALNTDPTTAIVFLLVIVALDLILVYNICIGIAEQVESDPTIDPRLAKDARTRWILYASMAGIGTLMMTILLADPTTSIRGGGDAGGLIALFFTFFVFAIIVIVLFLKLLRRAHHALGAPS